VDVEQLRKNAATLKAEASTAISDNINLNASTRRVFQLMDQAVR